MARFSERGTQDVLARGLWVWYCETIIGRRLPGFRYATGEAAEVGRAFKRVPLASSPRHPSKDAEGWGPPFSCKPDLQV